MGHSRRPNLRRAVGASYFRSSLAGSTVWEVESSSEEDRPIILEPPVSKVRSVTATSSSLSPSIPKATAALSSSEVFTRRASGVASG